MLANSSQVDQHNGIKEAEDLTDVAFLACLARLNILPTAYSIRKRQKALDLTRVFG